MCANYRQGTGQPEIREYPSDPGIRASTRREILKLGRVGVPAAPSPSNLPWTSRLPRCPRLPLASFEARTTRVNSLLPEALHTCNRLKAEEFQTVFYNIPRDGRSNALPVSEHSI